MSGVPVWQSVTVALALLVLLHEDGGDRLADDVGAPADDDVLAGRRMAGAVQQLDDAVGRGRPAAGSPRSIRPRLVAVTPSASFAGSMALMTTSSRICFGSGSWTRMPWKRGSEFRSWMWETMRVSSVLSGKWKRSEYRPACSAVSPFERTYDSDDGLSPTRTSARPGVIRRSSFSLRARSAISARTWARDGLAVDDLGCHAAIISGSRASAHPEALEGYNPRTMTLLGTIAAINRYPVKSMMGEELNAALVTTGGLAGDRAYALVDGDGRIGTAKIQRKWAPLFRSRARYLAEPNGDGLTPAEMTLPDGARMMTDEPDIDERLSDLLGFGRG